MQQACRSVDDQRIAKDKLFEIIEYKSRRIRGAFGQNPASNVASSHFKHFRTVKVGPVVYAKMLYSLRHFETSEFSDPKTLTE